MQQKFNGSAQMQQLVEAFNDPDEFRHLLEKSPKDSATVNHLFRAAIANDATEAAEFMLKTCYRLTVCRDEMLHEAAARGSHDMCKMLLKYDAKPIINRGDGTPLHYAVKWNDPKLCELFIAEGADVNAKNTLGQTPVTLAPVGKAPTIYTIKTLLDAGANPQDGDNVLLRDAAYHSDLALIKLLKERGANLACNDHRGKDLQELARRGQEAQRRSGAPDRSDSFRETIAFLAGELNNPQTRKPTAMRL